MKTEARIFSAVSLLAAACCIATSASQLAAQGCEPIRFTTPIDLGGVGQAYQAAHKWRLTLAYRRLHSDEFFVGTSPKPSAGPSGEAPVFNIHTFIADAAYSINSRVQLRVSVPFQTGTLTRKWPDALYHDQTATGIGDISVMGEAWLWRPESHENGNLAIGLGVKAPTGSHDIGSRVYTATGSVAFPADQPIQPGDGGWALLLQAQTFRRLTERTFVYGVGSYMMSPKAQSDVQFSPTSTVRWSVPDVYSARLGAAFSLLPEQGLSVSLGGRMDGIPTRDLVGGGNDSTIKRVSYVVYADPGLSLSRGRSSVTLSVPVRVSVNRKKSLLEERTSGVNGGGFAKYLMFASYSYRL
jgi:hypothetical protein